MHALRALQTDHDAIGLLLSSYAVAPASTQKAELAQQLIEELAIHASVEESVLFPAAIARGGALTSLARRGAEVHHGLFATLTDLERLLAKPDSEARTERMDAMVMGLIEQVQHHVQEDTVHFFPMLRRLMTAAELESIGLQLIEARTSAPRHPPRSAPRPSPVICLDDGSSSA